MQSEDTLRQDIINRFKEIVEAMPNKEKKIKKTSLFGLSPVEMLKQIQESSPIGNDFINKMIAIAYQEVCGVGKVLGTGNVNKKELN